MKATELDQKLIMNLEKDGCFVEKQSGTLDTPAEESIANFCTGLEVGQTSDNRSTSAEHLDVDGLVSDLEQLVVKLAASQLDEGVAERLMSVLQPFCK